MSTFTVCLETFISNCIDAAVGAGAGTRNCPQAGEGAGMILCGCGQRCLPMGGYESAGERWCSTKNVPVQAAWVHLHCRSLVAHLGNPRVLVFSNFFVFWVVEGGILVVREGRGGPGAPICMLKEM